MKPKNTTITLTLPSTSSGIQRRGTGTLLIQRGDLAHIQQFAYNDLEHVGAIIRQAEATLVGLEIDPPPDTSAPPEETTVETEPDASPDDENSEPEVPVTVSPLIIRPMGRTTAMDCVIRVPIRARASILFLGVIMVSRLK